MLISSLKKNAFYFKACIQQFIKFSVDDVLKRFNIILPLLTENIFINPRVVDNMTPTAKKELLAIFNIEGLYLYDNKGININEWSNQISHKGIKVARALL